MLAVGIVLLPFPCRNAASQIAASVRVPSAITFTSRAADVVPQGGEDGLGDRRAQRRLPDLGLGEDRDQVDRLERPGGAVHQAYDGHRGVVAAEDLSLLGSAMGEGRLQPGQDLGGEGVHHRRLVGRVHTLAQNRAVGVGRYAVREIGPVQWLRGIPDVSDKEETSPAAQTKRAASPAAAASTISS